MPTMEEYNKTFQQNNPQYFTAPALGQTTSDPAQMARNRAQLVKDSAGKLQEKDGKVIPIVSSGGGVTTLNNAVTDQQNDIAAITPAPKTDTAPEKPTTKRNEALENLGGITPEEAQATGVNVKDYTYDTNTGYLFLNSSGQERNQINSQFKEDENLLSRSLDARLASLDASSQALVSSIKGIYSQRISEQAEANKRSLQRYSTLGIRGGAGRYAPEIQNSILSGEEREGLKRIEKIATEEISALMNAQQALDDKRYKAFSDYRDEVKALRKERAEQLTKIQEAAQKELDYKRELLKTEKAEVTKIGLEASKNGASPEEVATILGYDNTVDAVNAAGDYLQTGTGDVGEYLFYKREAKKNGLLPLDYTGFLGKKAQLEAGKQIAIEKAKGGGVSGDISFDQFSEEQIALSAIPVQLRNTEAELKRFLDGIRKGIKAGKSPYEIADELIGYKIKTPDDFSNGMRQYISIAGLDNQEIANVARLINSGNKAGAISIIENKLMNEQKKVDPEGYVGESTSKYYASKVQEIKDTIESAGLMDSIGPIEGSASSIFGKVPLFKRSEAAKIQSKVTSLVAEMRNHLSGTAVTESEKKFLEPLISSLSDKKGVFITKLDEIKDNAILRTNQVRLSAQLPEMNEEQLLDRNKRSQLYSGSKIISDSIIQEESEFENQVIEYGKNNPSVQATITKMVEDGIPYEKIIKALGIQTI